MPTPSMEDYIEQIYILINQKGYARVSDIAEALSVHPSSVTKMVQKLDKDEYLVYEKYRGLILTPKGNKIGKRLVYRHDLLEQLLRTIGVKEENIYHDVEGIEHHLSWDAIDRIGDLVQYFEEDSKRVEELKEVQIKNEEQELQQEQQLKKEKELKEQNLVQDEQTEIREELEQEQ
ncbi:transcriptional regulator MntR [Bacillus sp. S/N-304-OC-R1]|nr:transcriptional regulator MntR [Bacillus sp. S/N-304-OC-R1]